VSVSQLDEIG
jgi:hypothetical protein